jgi:hypothetical protein
MMAWYEDIERLISMTGEARNAFVRRHVRSVSGASFRSSSDGVMDEDEADRTPYSAGSVVMNQERPTSQPRQPGGRFPSDVQIDRHLHAPLSPSSGESSGEKDLLAAPVSLPGSAPFGTGNRFDPDGDLDSNPNSNQSRAASSAAGGGQRFPIDGYDKYQDKYMASSDSFNQRQQLSQQAPTFDNNRVTIESPKEPSNTLFVAGLSSTSTQDHALSRQRNRGESASTAFTNSNVTDYTHNTHTTVPTSVDEESNDEIESVKPRPHSLHSEMSSLPTSVRNSLDIPKRPGAQTKNSVSTIELKIPGHYPPQQAAA